MGVLVAFKRFGRYFEFAVGFQDARMCLYHMYDNVTWKGNVSNLHRVDRRFRNVRTLNLTQRNVLYVETLITTQ